LDNLRRKHGSTSKRRRSSSSVKKRKQSHANSGTQSSLESLEILDSREHDSIERRRTTPSSSRSTATLKRKRDSPRCLGTSVLEDLHLSECNEENLAIQSSSNYLSSRTPHRNSTVTSQSSAASHKHQKHRPDLFFTGIVVLVNGYTDPDAETIKRLLQKHGGDLEKYETSRVTHIIAEQLSTAKANIYKRQRKPTPVCTPNWITESVDKKKLLHYADYLLKNVMDTDVFGSKKVKSCFGVKHMEEPTDRRREDKYRCNEVDKGDICEQRVENQLGESVTTRPYRWQDKDPREANYSFAGAKTIGNDPK